MLKKMYKLTLNELIKILIKPAVLIIIFLIFLFAAIHPIYQKSQVNKTNPTALSLTMNKSEITSLNSQIKTLNPKKASDKVKKTFIKSQVKQLQLMVDSKATGSPSLNSIITSAINIHSSWKSFEATDYLSILYKIDTINLLKDGINPSIISKNIPYNVSAQGIKEILAMPKDQYDSTLIKLNKEKDSIYNTVIKDDYKLYLNSQLTTANTHLKALEKELSTLNAKLKSEPTSVRLKTQISKLDTTISSLKEYIKVYEYRTNHNIAFDSKDWKSQTLTKIESLIPASQNKLATRIEFLSLPHNGVTYEQYVTNFNISKTLITNQIKTNWYSVENNIVKPNFDKLGKGSRANYTSMIATFAILTILFMIVIASGSVSKEFSKGTIKLLLIRPVSRFKVLASKLIALYIIGYGILFGSLIIDGISNGIAFGFSDYLVPLLKVSSGVVAPHNYIGVTIVHILFISISLLFFIAFTFMLSIITKNTAASVAISIILFVAAPIISIRAFAYGSIGLASSPLPYITTPAISIIKFLSKNLNEANILNPTLGGFEVAILAVICIIIGFIIFIKADVKK